MEHAVSVTIYEALKEIYGKDYVKFVSNGIRVTDNESNKTCKIIITECER